MDAAYVAEFSPVLMSFDAKITWQSIMYAPRTMMIVQKYQVNTIQGDPIEIEADTICIHGDGPNALAFAKVIHGL